MLDVNVQPVSLELTKPTIQESKVQGSNLNQDESSFSKMLENEQAKSTDGNQNTNKIDSKNADTKIDDVENDSNIEESILTSNNTSAIFVENNFKVNQLDNQITLSQIDYLENEPTDFSQKIVDAKFESANAKLFSLDDLDFELKNAENQKGTLTESDLQDVLNFRKKNISSKDPLEFVLEKKDFQDVLLNKSATEKSDLTSELLFENQINVFEVKMNEKITVTDERTAMFAQKAEKPNVSKEASKTGNYVKSVEGDSKASASVTMSIGQNLKSLTEMDGKPVANDFSSLLSREIQNSANKIVQSGSMILKDNNSGTINLILKPEALGTVKIKLEISDNQITGKILVASKEAYDAFNQNLNTLKNAFIDSGFNAGGFDLAFTGSGMNGNFNGEENQHANARTDGINSKGFVYEDSVSEVILESYSSDSINLVA